MGSSLNPHNWTVDWQQNIMTNTFVHIPTGVEVTQEMILDYGFPDPQYCRSAIAIRQWYFAKMTNARIAGTLRPHSQVTNLPGTQHSSFQNQQRFMNHYLTSKLAWYLYPDAPTQPIELLLCVESFIVRIPKYQIFVDSLEWLHCRTSKDSVWLSCSLVKSPVPIRLWEKDFILIQITPPGSDPISEVACGCKLKIVGPIVPGEVPQGRWEDLAIRDVPFFSISEMR